MRAAMKSVRPGLLTTSASTKRRRMRLFRSREPMGILTVLALGLSFVVGAGVPTLAHADGAVWTLDQAVTPSGEGSIVLSAPSVNNDVVQTFTAGKSGVLTAINVFTTEQYGQDRINAPLNISVYATDDSGRVTGDVLGSGSTPASSSRGWITAEIGGSVVVRAGELYAFRIRSSDPTGISESIGTGAYDRGQVFIRGNAWGGGTLGIAFQTYVDTSRFPASVSGTPPTAVIGQAYEYQLEVAGAPEPTVSYTGNLPPGLTLSERGLLAGTPTSAGSFTMTPSAQNSLGLVAGNPITVTVREGERPGVPTRVQASSVPIGVSWTAPTTGDPATSYAVTSSPAGAGCMTATTSCVPTGMKPGVPYTFQVTAHNTYGSSDPSSASNPVMVVVAPSAPTITTALSFDSQISLHWSPSDETEQVSRYVVQSRTVGGTWNDAASTNETSAGIEGLSNGVEYEFRVRAENAAGVSEWSPVVKATPRTVPSAPTITTALASDQQIELTWSSGFDGGSPLTGTVVQWRVAGSDSWTRSRTETGTSTVVDQLDNGTTYEFRTRSANRAGLSEWSEVVTATPHTVPNKPTVRTIDRLDGAIALTWSAGFDGGAAVERYEVQWRVAGVAAAWSDSIPTSELGATVTGLTNGTRYELRIRAVNAAGAGGWSNTASVLLGAAPAAPIVNAPIVGDSTVTLSWTAGADGSVPISAYQVQSRAAGTTAWLEKGLTEETTITIDELRNGTAYEFRVLAGNAIGPGAWSEIVRATPRTVPEAPTVLSAESGDASAVLTWSAGFDGGAAIEQYEVQWRIAATGTWQDHEPTTGLTTTITGLTNGTKYEARIRAVNVAGAGDWSALTTLSPRAAPAAPQFTDAAELDRALNVHWKPTDTGGSPITEYRLEYRVAGADAPWKLASETTKSPVMVSGLINGTRYEFRVRASNAIGDGPWSAVFTATPSRVADAPTSLTLTPGNGTIRVDWAPPVSDGGSAIIEYQVSYRRPGGGWFNGGSFTDTSATLRWLTNGVPIEVRVRAFNGRGVGSWSETATATPRTVPGAPTGITSAPHDGAVELSWAAPASDGGAELTGFEVQSRTAASEWAEAGTTTEPTLMIPGLENGTEYEFRVRAVNEAGGGAWSELVNTTPRTVADAPTWSSATPGDARVELSWAAPENQGGAAVSSYEVQSRLHDGEWTTAVSTSELSLTIPDLMNGSGYEFRVRAVNAAGAGSWSELIVATPRTVPEAPAIDAVVPADAAVLVSWSAAGNGGAEVTSFEVQSQTGTAEWTSAGTTLDRSLTVPGLVNGSEYEFRVRAVNEAGAGAWSTVASATPRTTAGAPAWESVVPGDTRVDLSWAAPENQGGAAVSSYEVQSRLDDGEWKDAGSTRELSLTASNLDNGSEYEFRVRAVNAAGAGAWSTVSTATPRTVPGSPEIAETIPGDGTAALTWTAPADDGGAPVTHYEVQAHSSDSDEEATIVTVHGTVATITGLENGVRTNLRVRAVNAAGAGAWSPVVETMPFRFVPEFTDDDGAPLSETLTIGDGVVVTGQDLPRGATVTLELHSAPTVLGTAVVADDGSFRITASIPVTASIGEHELIVTLSDSGAPDQEVRKTITVRAAPADDRLSDTGSVMQWELVVAGLLLLSFGGVMLRLRSRREVRSTSD